MFIELSDDELSTASAALIAYSLHWDLKADKGTEGRAVCQLLSARAMSLHSKLQGTHLPMLAIVPAPIAEPAPAAAAPKPNGGLKVVSPAPPPELPPSPVYAAPELPKLPPRAVTADIEF